MNTQTEPFDRIEELKKLALRAITLGIIAGTVLGLITGFFLGQSI